MLTKTLEFDDDVLEIIRSMKWQDGGTLGILTCGQLKRQMYLRVNKALDAMGGQWDRKRSGHVFRYDPRPIVKGLLDNGEITVEKDGFFETPIHVVEKMLSLINIHGKVLEPSAGLGAIADHIQTDNLVCVERNKQRAEVLGSKGYTTICGDFFAHDGEYDTIVMNPPFEQLQDVDHVIHAYQLLAQNGEMVSIMSESPFFRENQKAKDFRAWLQNVGGTNEKLPEGSFKESGTGVSARLVVIRKKLQRGNHISGGLE